MTTGEARQRLDKWLWFARFAKTRTLAQKLVLAGKIRLNKERIESPAHAVKPGDVLTIALERRILIVRVLAAGERRGPAPEAALLYEDLTPPVEPNAAPPVRSGPRPTKRDRRQISAIREDFSSNDD